MKPSGRVLSLPHPAPHPSSEELREYILRVRRVETPTPSADEPILQPVFPELVVHLFLLRVTQHLVRFRHSLEFLLGVIFVFLVLVLLVFKNVFFGVCVGRSEEGGRWRKRDECTRIVRSETNKRNTSSSRRWRCASHESHKGAVASPPLMSDVC